jgi:phage protein D
VAAARAPQGEEEEEEEEQQQQQQQQEEEEQQQQQQRQEGDDRQEGDPCWWPDGPAVQQATANSGTIWRRGQPPDFKDMPVSHEYFKDDWSNMVHAPLPPSLFIRFPSCATSPRV